jgi:hypothetical protein
MVTVYGSVAGAWGAAALMGVILSASNRCHRPIAAYEHDVVKSGIYTVVRRSC